jgi:hypothetical protein
MIKYTYLKDWSIKAFQIPSATHNEAYKELYARLEYNQGMFSSIQETEEAIKQLRLINKKT